MWRKALGLMLVVACATTAGNIDDLSTTDVVIGDAELKVALADTPESKQQGLMGVEEMPDGIDGMLFVYAKPNSVTFHMLDTPMPLDIWWFDEQGVLLGSTEMKPCFIEPCGSYGSPGPVKWVLETPSGVYGFTFGEVISTG